MRGRSAAVSCMLVAHVLLGSLGQVGKLQKEFSERGLKLAALSCNDTESHKA